MIELATALLAPNCPDSVRAPMGEVTLEGAEGSRGRSGGRGGLMLKRDPRCDTGAIWLGDRNTALFRSQQSVNAVCEGENGDTDGA